MKTGILMHVYHLETLEWEHLMWGEPDKDRLGSAPALVWLLLTEPADDPITAITIGCGPSTRDGLNEAAYTKRFMLERFDELARFPRLKPLLAALSPADRTVLKQRLEAIICLPLIRGTKEEIPAAADVLAGHQVDKVIQLCSASHAPRCIQLQAMSRLQGDIPAAQQWFVMPSDMCFTEATPDMTVVIEPPHRGDYALTHERPSLAELLKPTLYMPDDDKRALIALVKDFVERRQTP
jgi:hypothetical protein